ncbi:MAG: hypothetical protein ACRDVE_06675 [Actinocrinis sp.]
MSSPAQTPNPAPTITARPEPGIAPVPAPASAGPSSSARDGHTGFRAARMPWYGLDAGWRGKRRLGSLCTDLDGTVQYGTLLHGDAPTGRPGGDPQRRAVSVVTMAPLPRRPSVRPDGTASGFVEACTVAAAAAVAGIALVDEQWPWHLDVAVRQDWMDQQRELAAQIADRLGDMPWRLLTLTVDLQPQVFHYRESEYGWVLATATQQCLLAAYGRGVSAYSLAFTRVSPDDYDA